MVIREEITPFENRLGGKGTGELHVVLKAEQLRNHGQMVASIVLHPGSSIGYHQHADNMEVYYIMEGSGIFTRNDVKYPIQAGEAGTMEPGDFHGIENTGDTDMKIVAIVINK